MKILASLLEMQLEGSSLVAATDLFLLVGLREQTSLRVLSPVLDTRITTTPWGRLRAVLPT